MAACWNNCGSFDRGYWSSRGSDGEGRDGLSVSGRGLRTRKDRINHLEQEQT